MKSFFGSLMALILSRFRAPAYIISAPPCNARRIGGPCAASHPETGMKHDSLRQFLANPGTALSKGPIAMIFVEDACEIDSTLRHHLDRGFAHLLVFIPD